MRVINMMAALICLVLFAPNAEAQFLKNLKKSIEREVEHKIINKVNNELDKILITEQSDLDSDTSEDDHNRDDQATVKYVDDGLVKDFDFHDVDGTVQSLKQFDGQVIYLTFWASWCGPCKSNFKSHKKLREKLMKKGVVLLNVSLDENLDKWAKALDQHEYINGLNGRGSDVREIAKMYHVKSIPDYVIINKEGEFVSLTSEKTSDILDDFDQWLK